MKRKFTNIQNQLFFAFILVFVVGMVHISFSLFALICFITPFVLYFKYKDKIWCKYYCPRAGFFTKVIGKISLKKKMPKFFGKKQVKIGFVIYFAMNMLLMTISTIKVGTLGIPPTEGVRFMVIFNMPFTLPQLLELNIAPWVIHLGYSIYSMMFTTGLIGIVLGILYAPRTWCVVCPVSTLTTKTKAKIKTTPQKVIN